MRDLLFLLVHLIVTMVRLANPGGPRRLIAESVLLRHQLLILNRSRKRAPNLRPLDRVIAALCASLVTRARLLRSAIVLKPSTLLNFHRLLTRRKYCLLFSPIPGFLRFISITASMSSCFGPFGWGCRRIAQQIALAFGVELDKDVVRRVLAKHYSPGLNGGGPSWLTFLGHTKDSLWSCDLVRCESATLRTYWVLVVMDQFSGLPKYVSSDHDPLYRFHQWQANLRVLGVTEIKTVPYVPLSHPFVERLVGTIRRELLDRTLFWSAADLEEKLIEFQHCFNGHRTHGGLEGRLPDPPTEGPGAPIELVSYRWQKHCGGLYQTPIAA